MLCQRGEIVTSISIEWNGFPKIPSSWVHLSTLMNLQHLPLLLQITEAVLEMGRKYGGGGVGAALLMSGRINHWIIYRRALFGKSTRATDLDRCNLAARHWDVNNKSSLAFHLWAIKRNQMAQDAGSSWTCGEQLSAEPAFKRIHSLIFQKEKKKKKAVICSFEYQKGARARLLDCSKKQKPSRRFAGRCVMINY